MSQYFHTYALWSAEPLGSATISTEDKRCKLNKLLANFEEDIKRTLDIVVNNSDFADKYDVWIMDDPLLFVSTRQPNEFTFVAEVFPVVRQPVPIGRRMEEFTFHKAFEEVIERYTNERRKPNPVLQETRSSNFCYQLTIKFEAVDLDKAIFPESSRLLREFHVLQHIWESFHTELVVRQCPPDQLVGFPMPFEFKNVVGSEEYDFPKIKMDQFYHFSLNGKSVPLCQQPISLAKSVRDVKCAMSSLSYMSVEKVGPSLPYLMDVMQSQGQRFSLSTALKIYDQLICRLMVLHKYGIVHCDINPRCLNFGCREAANVLYINNFERAVLYAPNSHPLPSFHDRFVSHAQVKEKKCHYLHDLESAFYVFIYMLLNRLPWDSRLQAEQDASESSQEILTNKSVTTDLKEKFWHSASESMNWVIKSVTHEYSENLYCNFSMDLLETMYAKMKEGLASCLVMQAAAFKKEIFITGSGPHNCYFGVRKVIASYFRFENLNQPLRDVICASKLEMLLKHSPTDKRVAWDLSCWCWHYLIFI